MLRTSHNEPIRISVTCLRAEAFEFYEVNFTAVRGSTIERPLEADRSQGWETVVVAGGCRARHPSIVFAQGSVHRHVL